MSDLRLIVPALVGWAVAVALLPHGIGVSCGTAALATGVAVAAHLSRRRLGRTMTRAVALAGLVTALLLVAAAGHRAVRTAGPVADLAAQGAVVDVVGVMASDPRVLPADEEHPRDRVMVRLTVTQIVARGRQARVRTPVLIVGGDELRGLRFWERVELGGRLRPADDGDDVVAVLTQPHDVRRVSEAGRLARGAEHMRVRLRESVDALPADPRGLVPALVIGDRSLTPQELTDDMRATGMTHLSAVSGSNVAIVLAAGLLMCRVLGVRRRWRPFVAGGVLVGFVVLARPDPSVLRAAVMGAVGLLGLSVSRRSAGMPALAAAVVVLLVVDPWLARSYGFALSTLATLGLLVFARPWGAALARRLPPRLAVLGEATAIPLAAQAMCAPVVVLLQGSVTLVGVAANMLAAPFVAPATVAGVACAVGGAAWAPAGSVLAWVAVWPAWAIAWVAHVCAEVPFGTLGWPDGATGAFLLAALTLALVAMGPWLGYRVRRHPVVAAGVVAVLSATFWPVGSTSWLPSEWEFVACDVGQADALVLSTGPGRAVVVDAGQTPDAVDGCLDRLGVQVVDALVLTHFHADHVLGMPGVLRGRTVSSLYVNPVDDPPAQARQVRRWAAEAGLTPEVVRTGRRLAWGPVQAEVRWPSTVLQDGSVSNNAGIVLDVRTASLRMLLLADVEREAARRIAADLRDDEAAPRFDMVKVAHHGSANTDPGLLELVAAPVAVISVGEGNDHGHPTAKTLDLLARTGALVRRTDRDGDVALGVVDGRPVVGHRRG